MPSDEEICEVFPAMTYAQRSKVAIIAAFAVKRALAAQEARHKRELIEARIHELNLNGCRAETPTLRRLEDLRAELADLEEKP